MSAPATPAPSGSSAGRTEPGERGTLQISERAIERIATTTALQAPAVISQDATFGRGLPKVKAQLAGQRVRLDVEVAILWGHPLADVAAEVRGRVARTVAELTGFGVDVVNVDISAVELPKPDTNTTSAPRRLR
ncbi:Asp23/Gls24 family envelope stress response protein [Kribbella sp. NBC_01505]|uniref:Asp23/Gls24 family envelope stress response protein n=1 Tax=Kribbella sp. NBC_01505 TaxID=2903580 RepID=UPI00387058B0